MTPTPSAARRLPPLGCALAAAAALAFAGCGGSGDATADNAHATRPEPRAKANVAPATRERCPAKVTAFADALDRLRHRLAIGLSYEQYAARVKQLRKAYAELPIDRLTIACLTTTGTPTERAFNKYIDAANAWGECLADASCTTATIEPILQRKWRVASHSLSEAE
jgi:hypothetical protein